MDSRHKLGGVLVLAAVFLGCNSDSKPNDAPPDSAAGAEDTALRLLVVDDPEMAAIIERQWNARQPAELTVVAKSWDEIGEAPRLDADAVIYPSALVGELAERKLIAPIDENALAELEPNRQDVFEQIRMRETRWGEQAYAVSFGSPTLMLLYRPDLFEKLGLSPPRDWTEYRQTAERLANRSALGALAPPEGAPWRGTLEPLGTGWAGQMLLARGAAYALHRSQYSTVFSFVTMAPRIDGPPFERSLRELVDCASLGPSDGLEFSPADVRREFFAGRCGMAITWPTSAGETPEGLAGDAPIPVGFAELPGGLDVYNNDDQRWENRLPDESTRVPLLAAAGRLGSTTLESPHRAAALAALVTLASPEWSSDIATRSTHTTLCRYSQTESAGQWVESFIEPAAARQYAETLSQSLSRDNVMTSLRIPGRRRYLAALDAAVAQAVKGEKQPDAALVEAAAAWTAITDELGKDQQKTAYRRSLGVAK